MDLILELPFALKTPVEILFDAVIGGDPKAVKTSIHLNRNNVNVVDSYSTPLIYHAVIRGDVEILSLLLEYGADVNVHQKHILESPLYYAVRKGFVDIARELIKYGSHIHCVDTYGSTLLHYALYHGKDMVEVLLQAGTRMDIDNGCRVCPFRESVMQGSEEVVRVFLEYGANVNLKDIFDKSTALHCAVMKQNIGIVKLLLEYGADVFAKDLRNKTPLHYAASYEQPEIVNMLVQCGADINDNVCKETPLHCAVRHQRLTNVRLLIDRGAKLDITESEFGKTPLHFAAEKLDKNIVSLLLQHGASLTALTTDGKSALQLAVEESNQEIVDVLLLYLFIRQSLDLPIADVDRDYIRDKKQGFKEMCDKELMRMKVNSITCDCDTDFYVSYYTFITSNINKALKFCRKSNTIDKLKGENFEQLFPLYANMILYRVAMGCNKYDLYYKTHRILQDLFGERYNLPTDVTFHLVNYMNEHDKRFLVHSHYIESGIQS